MDSKRSGLGLFVLALLPLSLISCKDNSTGNGLQISYQTEYDETYSNLIQRFQEYIDSRDEYIEGIAELFDFSDPNIIRNIGISSRTFTYQSSDAYGMPVTLSAIMTYPSGLINGPVHTVSSILLAMPPHMPYDEGEFSETGSPIELRAALYNSIVVIPDRVGVSASGGQGNSLDPILAGRQALDALDYAVKLANEDHNLRIQSGCPTSIIGFGKHAVTACAATMMVEEGSYNYKYNSNRKIKSAICAQTEITSSSAEYATLSNAMRYWRIDTPIHFLHILNDEIAPYNDMLKFKNVLTTISGNSSYIHTFSEELSSYSSTALTNNENANIHWLVYTLINRNMELE